MVAPSVWTRSVGASDPTILIHLWQNRKKNTDDIYTFMTEDLLLLTEMCGNGCRHYFIFVDKVENQLEPLHLKSTSLA